MCSPSGFSYRRLWFYRDRDALVTYRYSASHPRRSAHQLNVATGTPQTGWEELDANPTTVQIVPDGDAIYQRHNDGRIFYLDLHVP